MAPCKRTFTNLEVGSPVELFDMTKFTEYERTVRGKVLGLRRIIRDVGKNREPQCRVHVKLDLHPFTEIYVLEEKVTLLVD